MLKFKVPFFVCLLFGVGGAAITVFCSRFFYKATSAVPISQESPMVKCTYTKHRLDGYNFVKPLLFVEPSCPSPDLDNIRNQLQTIIEKYKQQGTIENASVYLGVKGEWLNIGENDKYLPGSLMKVPELITILKMNEKNPGLLDKKFFYDKPFTLHKNAVFLSKTIQPGNTYTVKELLYYMIVYSDNNATTILNSIMDIKVFKKLFTDLGMPEPDLTKPDIPLTTKQFSFFMRAIYNATYLTVEDSEFSAELLSKCSFSEGLVDGLPKGIQVAHKFGEAGDMDFAHFAESAIVYTPNGPYLLTVMTKGKDLKVLPGVVKEISRSAFNMVNIM